MATSIPKIDISTNFADGLLEAFESTGFVRVSGLGVREGLFVEMREMLRQLFELGDETKSRLMIERGNYRGFVPLGFFTPNRSDRSGAQADLYEAFKLHWECPNEDPVRFDCALYGSNRWVDEVSEMRALIVGYWAEMDRISDAIYDPISAYLGIDKQQFRSWFDKPLTNMTLLHYPASAGPASPGDDVSGIHPHKDTNVITLLHPDEVGGLQVQSANGSWIDVVAEPDELVVNIGEMLELWSGGRLKATPHRVMNLSGMQRYSFPYFTVPRHDITVKALLPPIDGFTATSMPVGALSAEVWRTNWPDETPDTNAFDLGSLD